MCTTSSGWSAAASRPAASATAPFVDEALEQARLLGMPAYRMVFIPHPVQLLTPPSCARADALPQIVARLVTPGGG